jgi:hypothetical protein
MLSPEIEYILNQEGIQLMNDIRANMGSAGMNATNETSHSLKIQIQKDGTKTKLSLLGRPYFMTVQTGRKPTPGKKPSREMIDRITAWVEARNMDVEAVWAIATNIQNKGTKLWQSGGRTDIVDPAVEDFIKNVQDKVAEAAGQKLVTEIRKMKW